MISSVLFNRSGGKYFLTELMMSLEELFSSLLNPIFTEVATSAPIFVVIIIIVLEKSTVLPEESEIFPSSNIC